ncbi:hypothetical protein FRC08_017290 [Ceratobasidium sp. 394]|nr:hypothetical protein FRC08_017290 [Ceratobasidium sp. 394]
MIERIEALGFHASIEGPPPLAIFEDKEPSEPSIPTSPSMAPNSPTLNLESTRNAQAEIQPHDMLPADSKIVKNCTMPKRDSSSTEMPTTFPSSSSGSSLSLDSNSSPPLGPALTAPILPAPTFSPIPLSDPPPPPPGSPPPAPPPDDAPAPPPGPPPSLPPPPPPPSDSFPFPSQRWAYYRTTYFQSDRLPVSLVSRPLPSLEAPPPPPSVPPPPPPPPSTSPPPPPEEPPKVLSEQERRKLLWERILAGQTG